MSREGGEEEEEVEVVLGGGLLPGHEDRMPVFNSPDSYMSINQCIKSTDVLMEGGPHRFGRVPDSQTMVRMHSSLTAEPYKGRHLQQYPPHRRGVGKIELG